MENDRFPSWAGPTVGAAVSADRPQLPERSPLAPSASSRFTRPRSSVARRRRALRRPLALLPADLQAVGAHGARPEARGPDFTLPGLPRLEHQAGVEPVAAVVVVAERGRAL